MAEPYPHHLRRTLTLGLPLVGSFLAQILIGITDTAMLGRYSAEALAASALAHSSWFSLFILGSGFAFAAMSLVADAEGRGDTTTPRRATRMAAWWSVGFAVAVYPVFVLSEPLFRLAQQGDRLAADAADYLIIAGVGMLPALITQCLRSHLSALERTRIVLWATLAAAALNVGVNWLLIFGNLGFPELGLRGAAVASVFAHATATVVLALYAAKGPGMAAYRLFRNPWRPDPELLGRIARLGWPIGLTGVAETSLFFGAALMMGALGTIPLAAHGIALQIASASFVIHLGLSQAATVRVGRAFGAGAPDDLRRAAWAAVALSMVVVALTMAVFLLAGRDLAALFLDRSDPAADAVLDLAAMLVIVAGVFQLVDAVQVMALGFLRGLQDTRVPMLLAVASYFGIGIPASLVLGFALGLGALGIWAGMVLGLAAASGFLMVRFLRVAPPLTPPGRPAPGPLAS
ncbi:MATE family efflux transporter [Jannaschia sp. Os4]|uniref:MATE family efflux transporter n=1 Tax=Jannaschia sp. Os4 TaxID=2807617 RepID=UPI00193986AB|nr:MATE family efflux transporter [Jannaschia sp. Os4]MBM2577503.1 MATE family efflux transporter [Jannaschia sp. Os4]